MPDLQPERRRDSASRVISADPEVIWRAFADPDALMAWLPPSRMTGRALVYEFREGGRYRIELEYDASAGQGAGKTTERTDVTTGRFLELDPGRRVVQTVEFESADPSFGGEMLMTWSFEPVAGGTRVTITADDVPPGISQADHDAGLRGSLENLSAYVGDPSRTSRPSAAAVGVPSFRANNELALHVADPAAAAAFYAQVLGGEIADRTQDCIEVVSGALRLFLLRDPAPTHDRVVPSFDVPDRAAALERLRQAGCTFVEIGPHAPGGVYVRDPFGVVFDVVERATPATGRP